MIKIVAARDAIGAAIWQSELDKNDSVRTELKGTDYFDLKWRINNDNRQMAYIETDQPFSSDPDACICIAFVDDVPVWVDELEGSLESSKILCCYSVWSNKRGAGVRIINELLDYVKKHHDNIERVITLSPKTEMAAKFHIKNGATLLQENEKTVNFEYKVER